MKGGDPVLFWYALAWNGMILEGSPSCRDKKMICRVAPALCVRELTRFVVFSIHRVVPGY